MSGEDNYQQHLASKKHARRLVQLAKGSVPQHSVHVGALAAQQAQQQLAQQAQQPRTYLGAGADLAPYVDQVQLVGRLMALQDSLLGWLEAARHVFTSQLESVH